MVVVFVSYSRVRTLDVIVVGGLVSVVDDQLYGLSFFFLLSMDHIEIQTITSAKGGRTWTGL